MSDGLPAGVVLGLGLGGTAIAVLLASVSTARAAVPLASSRPPTRATTKPTRRDWIKRVIERVSRHEGGYDSLNRNTDRAGLSFGVLQWAQATGDLGQLLAAMQRTEPEAFREVFGPDAPELLRMTGQGSLAAVGGAVLWHEPWVSRFRAAGAHPGLQAVQRELARTGPHFRAALQTGQALGVRTERAIALFFDTAVQQGAGAAEEIGSRLKAALTAKGAVSVPYDRLLATYAQAAANRARRTHQPSAQPRSARLRWVQIGNAWHLHAGSIDLYENIAKRRQAILRDPSLADQPLASHA